MIQLCKLFWFAFLLINRVLCAGGGVVQGSR